MTTQFDSNTFEHDYICEALCNMVKELKTSKDEVQIVDKYAVQITAFMTGQIRSDVVNTIKYFHKK